MELIKGILKIKFAILLVFITMYLVYKNSSTEIYKFDLKFESEGKCVLYFLVKNPPVDSVELCDLLYSHSQLIVKNEDLKKYVAYSISYYEESLTFNRFYKPDYKWYNMYVLDDIRDGDSHMDNFLASVNFVDFRDQSITGTNYPNIILHKKKLIYFPFGFKNSINEKWRRIK